jgi:uncharacterized membrane protein
MSMVFHVYIPFHCHFKDESNDDIIIVHVSVCGDGRAQLLNQPALLNAK